MTDINQEQPQSKHNALHNAFSKQVWAISQKRVLQFWTNEKALKARRVFTKRNYLPLVKPWVKGLPDDITVLEVGSGPVCMAQYFRKGDVTYIDPLMDQYRKMFPGVMPESATYIAEMAENKEWKTKTFDVVICLNTLSDVHNPELILNKTAQILKKDGVFAVSIDIWPVGMARLHFFLSRFMPLLPQFNRLYSYSHQGFTNTLKRHFNIESEQVVNSKFSLGLWKTEILFICKHKPV
ncbi:MAG: methyltransferase domain-containing protein [Ghiorsea sp.]